MACPLRNSVKIILLNEKDELLLMCADNPKITSADGEYHGRFWFLTGGEIEKGESTEEAAIRELHEETGLKKEEVTLGPIVWFGEFDLQIKGILTHLKQTFIVARTKKKKVSFTKLDEWEKESLEHLCWFSLEDIKNCPEVIYPVDLPEILPSIISGRYPKEPLEIDLAKQPKKKS
jgi:8-oxo-dGTP pyrophosphatase MutT (NUDIX family)